MGCELQALRVGGSVEQVHIELLHIRVIVAGYHSRDSNGTARAGDRTVGSVRGRNGLDAWCVQGGEEEAGAVGQSKVRRQSGSAVAAGEVNGAAVADRLIVESIQSLQHAAATNGCARRGAARGGDEEVGGSAGTDGDGTAGPSDRAGSRIRNRQCREARRLECGAEGAGAVGQGAVGRQHCLSVGAREMHRACITRGGIVERVQSSHGETKGGARRGARRSADGEVRSGGGADGDGVAGAGD